MNIDKATKIRTGEELDAAKLNTYLKNKMGTSIVMFFVPSEAIESQTLRKFRDRKDPHRQILDQTFYNKVKVFSTQEALSIKKEDVENMVMF